jgi:hypothetical protein
MCKADELLIADELAGEHFFNGPICCTERHGRNRIQECSLVDGCVAVNWGNGAEQRADWLASWSDSTWVASTFGRDLSSSHSNAIASFRCTSPHASCLLPPSI